MSLCYLVFEGIDGCGKHEQIELLSAYLFKRGITPIQLLEPSHGPYGEEIRQRLQSGELGTLPEQHALFTRDRRDHVETKIKPLLALARGLPGFMILQSRTHLSAAAYQAEVGADDEALMAIVREQESFTPAPDRILILDLPVDAAIDRLERVHRRDCLEQKENLSRAHEIYVRLAMIHPKCTLIDAQGSPGEVASRVRQAVQLDWEGEVS